MGETADEADGATAYQPYGCSKGRDGHLLERSLRIISSAGLSRSVAVTLGLSGSGLANSTTPNAPILPRDAWIVALYCSSRWRSSACLVFLAADTGPRAAEVAAAGPTSHVAWFVTLLGTDLDALGSSGGEDPGLRV